VLGDRVRVRFEVRVKSILFICTTYCCRKNKQKMVASWYIGVVLQFKKKTKYCKFMKSIKFTITARFTIKHHN